MLANESRAADPVVPEIQVTRYFKVRSGFDNTLLRIQSGETVRVVFLGGSITEHGAWVGHVQAGLKKRFPKAEFDFVNAGISSYDSTSDAFRYERDVTSAGRVDLLFVDCAVNDLHNGRYGIQSVRAMEGILRKARKHNPMTDVLVMHFADKPHVDRYLAKALPDFIETHEMVAAHYGVPTIDMALLCADGIGRGNFTWKHFGGAHPSAFGHQLYAAAFEKMFDEVWGKPLADGAKQKAHSLPEKPLDALNYENGRLLDLEATRIVKGWRVEPTPGVSTRSRHKNAPFLIATEAGAELTIDFEGTAIGYLGVVGPDCGMLDYRIDEGPWKTFDPFTRWSTGQNLGWTHILEAELKAGKHTLTLRTSKEKNPKSKGNACRIRRFVAN